MASKHTPGEWFVERVGHADEYIIVAGEGAGQKIAQLYDKRGSFPQAEMDGHQYLYGGQAEANANLMGASKLMLEALQEAEKHFGPFAEITVNGQHDPDDVRVVRLIRAAIAKATGAA